MNPGTIVLPFASNSRAPAGAAAEPSGRDRRDPVSGHDHVDVVENLVAPGRVALHRQDARPAQHERSLRRRPRHGERDRDLLRRGDEWLLFLLLILLGFGLGFVARRFSLLILDELHRVRERQPMERVAERPGDHGAVGGPRDRCSRGVRQPPDRHGAFLGADSSRLFGLGHRQRRDVDVVARGERDPLAVG